MTMMTMLAARNNKVVILIIAAISIIIIISININISSSSVSNNNNNNIISVVVNGFSSSSSSSSSYRTTKSRRRRSQQRLLVRAGFSGLSVAYHLMKMIDEDKEKEKDESRIGVIDIEIIEARNRIGGRVHSYNFLSSNQSISNSNLNSTTGGDNNSNGNGNGNGNEAPCWIDLGGQWLHGASYENPIRRLMEDDLDLTLVSKSNTNTNTNTNTNRFYKKRSTNVLFDKYGTKMNNGIVQRAKNLFYKSIDDLEVDDEDDDDLEDVNYDTRTSYQDLINNRLKPLYNEENEGGPLQLVSAKLANNLYYGFDGPDLIPQGSYKSVLDGIITKLNLNLVGHDISTEEYNDSRRDRRRSKSSSCRIRLRMNTKVSRIEYDNDNDNDDSEVSITVEKNISSTINITSITAAAAAAVGPEEEEEEELEEILKADYCVCTVPLGVLKSGDIQFIPPLSKEKQEAIHGIGFGILNKIVYKFPVSTNGTKFWGNDIKQFGYCHDDISLIKTYYDCTDDYIINDTTTPHKESKEAILIQFLAGKAADRIDPPPGGGSGIGISDEEIIEESMHTLRLIFGDDGIHNVPEPICTPIVTRWNNDQYSYGSYSYTKINSSAKMYTDIAAPATPSLFFAGEHTSKHYHSTVHGAWSTGKREAERIMEQISSIE
ncbi:amine oxidase [Fragilariopsis cylindrus CCMP1102]|uniref:Amine oxidase n=1 Tax=Fragilariopsis cylindrus CCMP1102 TaxID=635003 RepID=A0A1E7EV45_9STRA|nr:amine oxidase [Fragilariopsis cylindrus CCMP1102]|eukprot:OEU09729.1 amine oxidase [Fragilariopsis cylindrus CCMP1102]